MVMQRGQAAETVAHWMQGRCEVFGLGQDVPADVFCYLGGKYWGDQLRAYVPLSMKHF